MKKSEAAALAAFTVLILIVVLGLQTLLTRENAFWTDPDRPIARRAP